MKKELLNKYCEFIFPVLFEVEKIIPEHSYSRQRRTIGYFGEWSLGLFFFCEKIKTKTIPFVGYESQSHTTHNKKNLISKLKYKYRLWHEDKRKRKALNIVFPDDVLFGLENDGTHLKKLKNK